MSGKARAAVATAQFNYVGPMEEVQTEPTQFFTAQMAQGQKLNPNQRAHPGLSQTESSNNAGPSALHASGIESGISNSNPGNSGKRVVQGKYSIKLGLSNLGEWVIDSGATDHMTYSEKDLTVFRKPLKDGIFNANGVAYPVTGAGDVPISNNLILKNTLLVPSLSKKLVSIGKLTRENNCVVLMFSDFCIFQDILTKEIIGHGTKRDGLYYLDELKMGNSCLSRTDSASMRDKVWLWHKRLGHPSIGYMRKLSPHLFYGLNNDVFNCETCIKAKSHRTTFHDSSNKSLVPFDLVHTDVWGPSPVISKSGYRWFIIFTDDCTRMTWLYLLKTKDEVSNVFQDFFNMIKTQFEKEIKIVRSDNGTEYVNKNLQMFFKKKEILHETSCVGTPQQNGVVERKKE